MPAAAAAAQQLRWWRAFACLPAALTPSLLASFFYLARSLLTGSWVCVWWYVDPAVPPIPSVYVPTLSATDHTTLLVFPTTKALFFLFCLRSLHSHTLHAPPPWRERRALASCPLSQCPPTALSPFPMV